MPTETRTSAGYETRDARPGPILGFGLALAAIVIAGMAIALGLWLLFERTHLDQQPEVSPLADRELPNGPRLEETPAQTRQAWEPKEAALLDGYGWVDRDKKRVRIPLTEAQRLVIERGLPRWAPTNPKVPVDPIPQPPPPAR